MTFFTKVHESYSQQPHKAEMPVVEKAGTTESGFSIL